jgi:hypothetical protein
VFVFSCVFASACVTHSIIFKCLRVALVQVIENHPLSSGHLQRAIGVRATNVSTTYIALRGRRQAQKKESSSLTSLTQVPALKTPYRFQVCLSLSFSLISLFLFLIFSLSLRAHNHTRHRFLGFSDFKDPPPLHTHTHTHTHTHAATGAHGHLRLLSRARSRSLSFSRALGFWWAPTTLVTQ